MEQTLCCAMHDTTKSKEQGTTTIDHAKNMISHKELV